MAFIYLFVCIAADILFLFFFTSWYFGGGFMDGYETTQQGMRTPWDQRQMDHEHAQAEMGLVTAITGVICMVQLGVGHFTLGLDMTFGNETLAFIIDRIGLMTGAGK
jgi:hypothetical protein